jgi:hypothetical protein
MINEATRQFIKVHREEDVRKLALGSHAEGVDLPLALQQIAGWQTARKKLPSWAAVDGIIYPPHLNMEQCSSEQTAKYKGSLTPNPSPSERGTFVDLTGGFGIDFYFMVKGLRTEGKGVRAVYVEHNPELCEIARHNFQVLGLEAEVMNGEAEDYLKKMTHADIIYLDPARRDAYGSRTYDIKDCTPNVIELMPLLLEKADTIILKLSPMLDWRKAVKNLGHVAEVHIVSIDNECKELLLVVKQQPCTAFKVICVNNDDIFEFAPSVHSTVNHEPLTMNYLYEPNASIMKAGCFQEIEKVFDVCQLSNNSHLFVSEKEIKKFPGRLFHIETVTSMNKQELKAALQGIERANIAVRNFPMSAEALRKKLRLKDGGEVFIFATTLSDNSHKLFVCRKIG